MDAPSVSNLDPQDESRAIATVVSAFAADPVERWLYPGDEEYGRHFPEFAAAFGGGAFAAGTAWALERDAAVALWFGPGTEPDEEAIASVLTRTVAEEKHEELFAVLGQMDDAHLADSHWYLPWLAVQPSRQGEGLGGRLLAHCLEIVDESGLPAFLETPNPRKIGLYERNAGRKTPRTPRRSG